MKLFLGQETVDLAMKEAKQVFDLLKLASMTACKWHTNNDEVLQLIPEELKSEKLKSKFLEFSGTPRIMSLLLI